ncbi:hypothetical protein CPC08DRAFT_714981 [Agrocybe pediades]|nr:hypothetical protein CPC08DRAFT_714981 [Agrocybe pediades]
MAECDIFPSFARLSFVDSATVDCMITDSHFGVRRFGIRHFFSAFLDSLSNWSLCVQSFRVRQLLSAFIDSASNLSAFVKTFHNRSNVETFNPASSILLSICPFLVRSPNYRYIDDHTHTADVGRTKGQLLDYTVSQILLDLVLTGIHLVSSQLGIEILLPIHTKESRTMVILAGERGIVVIFLFLLFSILSFGSLRSSLSRTSRKHQVSGEVGGTWLTVGLLLVDYP